MPTRGGFTFSDARHYLPYFLMLLVFGAGVWRRRTLAFYLPRTRIAGKLTHITLGSIALTCAAVDDVTAWCIMALVIPLVKSTELASTAMTIGVRLVED